MFARRTGIVTVYQPPFLVRWSGRSRLFFLELRFRLTTYAYV